MITYASLLLALACATSLCLHWDTLKLLHAGCRESDLLPLLPRLENWRKARCFLLAGFKRSQFIFPPALLTSLNCLFFFPSVVPVGGEMALKQNKGWSLSQVHCSSAAVASHLYHLCFAPSQLFSFPRLTGDLAEAEHLFDVSGVEAVSRKSGRGHFRTDDLQTVITSAGWSWSWSLSEWQLVTLFLFIYYFFYLFSLLKQVSAHIQVKRGFVVGCEQIQN